LQDETGAALRHQYGCETRAEIPFIALSDWVLLSPRKCRRILSRRPASHPDVTMRLETTRHFTFRRLETAVRAKRLTVQKVKISKVAG